MLHLLRRNEKENLRSKLLDENILFKAFRTPIRVFEAEVVTGFRLSPEEVFWQVVIVLDKIKEHQKDAWPDIRGLWNDIYIDYRELSDKYDDKNVRLFASLTVFVVQVCLGCIDVPLYRTMAFEMASQLAKENQPSERMKAAVLNNIARIGTCKFETILHDYMNSDGAWLSEDIKDILDDFSVATEQGNLPDSPPVDSSSLRIAQGKQTSITVILEAMYKAGWIEKSNGEKVTNRDDVIKEVLKRAFNVTKASPTQILQAAKDPIKNKLGIDKYFDELKSVME